MSFEAIYAGGRGADVANPSSVAEWLKAKCTARLSQCLEPPSVVNYDSQRVECRSSLLDELVAEVK